MEKKNNRIKPKFIKEVLSVLSVWLNTFKSENSDLSNLYIVVIMDDIIFLQDLFKRFVPGGGGKSKHPKHPVFKGWLNVTPEQSAELARHARYPFIFLTGKATEFMTVDLDRKDPARHDHTHKKDGVDYWEEHFKEHMNTLIIRTPRGGYHLVYKYHEGIKSGQLEKDATRSRIEPDPCRRLERLSKRLL